MKDEIACMETVGGGGGKYIMLRRKRGVDNRIEDVWSRGER